MKQRGHTLIELLFVLSIITLLVSLLFPVLYTARAKARQTACASNLHQIGLAIAMYAQDYDDFYPYGADPADKYTSIWSVDHTGPSPLASMPLLQDVLFP